MSAAMLHPGAAGPAILSQFPAPPADLLPVLAEVTRSGFPDRRTEAWRFSDPRRLVATAFRPAAPDDTTPGLAAAISDLRRAVPDADLLVLVNGRLSADHSVVGPLPDGVVLGEPALEPTPEINWPGPDYAFARLNQVYRQGGLVLVVPDGVAMPRPIQVLHWVEAADPVTAQVHLTYRLAPGATAAVMETYGGPGLHWSNVTHLVMVGDGARLQHVKHLAEGADAFQTSYTQTLIGKAARYEGFTLSLGNGFNRQDFWATIAGDGGYCGFSGASLLSGRGETAIASVINHAAPHTRTREVFKTALADRAHGVFQGKIHVHPVAQKTDAFQLTKALLLSDRAVMDAKPELEIYADDVKCSHGATVGDLDQTALFYLRSRGIDLETARNLLIEAFVLDVVEEVAEPAFRTCLVEAIEGWLARREGGVGGNGGANVGGNGGARHGA